MQRLATQHPIWEILRHQGRDLIWLAARTGYSHSHVKAIATGRFEPTLAFRARCALAFDLPERVLFHPETASLTPVPAP